MKQIAAAFIAAKRAFGPALKDKTNPQFRSKYADLGACIDAVDDALLKNGIAFTQETFENDSGVMVETVFIHESGESMRCGKLHVPAAKQDPQGYGSALTYARRYSLMTACGIAPEDDDGNAARAAEDAKRKAERERWLADQKAAVEAASTGAEFKRIVEAAIVAAQHENDADAEAQIRAAAATKAAKARKPAKEDAQ